MATVAKTVVATGGTSGLGFEVIKQLLAQSQPYRLILGARNPSKAQADFSALKYDTAKHDLTVLPLELSDLKTVRTFAGKVVDTLGGSGSATKIDYLLLNAAISIDASKKGGHGSKWCEAYIVNHLSQHYLLHLLREKLTASASRIVVVSSGAVRNVPDPSVLEHDLKDNSGVSGFTTYSQTKFVQLLGAHWWRRHLAEKCVLVAVSPGLIPGTGLGRGSGISLPTNSPDAKSIPEGAQSILAAFTRDDLPSDPEQIFLTSWGEWWPKSTYEKSLDRELQEKWSPSREEIEAEEGLQ